jgi:uncharacterized protein (TIGR03437 family)
MTPKATIVPILFAAAYCNPALAQTPSTLKIEIQNLVFYEVDNADASRFGTSPNVTASGLSCAGQSFGGHLGNRVVGLGDIVAVNGQPAKGTYVSSGATICVSPTPAPGQPIADTSAGPMVYETYQILQSDGTPVGTIMANGLRVAGPSPPGPPAGNFNSAIVGGTGAFFGVRGQAGNANGNLGASAPSSRSITEDPALRRTNGGMHAVFTLYVISLSRPEIAMTPDGPAIVHSNDFSPVSYSKPASPGEILSLFATGLGPTRPGVDPGQPFPPDPPAVVNSPLQVTANGKVAEVLGAVGLPGAVDGYQVNFRMPADAQKGPVTIQVSAAWIAGQFVSIPVQ